MAANFSRVKNWGDEILTNEDLNAEIDNILNNLGPSGVGDYSTNAAQMRLSADPGEAGSESLATSLAGELERLRFVIKEMKGTDVDYWYESSTASLSTLNTALGSSIPVNRIVSGRKRSTSEQLIALVPNGAARTVTLAGTPTPFIYYINGTQYTISSDVTLTGLTAAPSTANTCVVSDANAADQDYTKYEGENRTRIPIGTVGANISALAGQFAAFKLENGVATEYFVAYVADSTSLTRASRGYFFDSSDDPIPRIAYANGDTITLMKLTWIFATTAGNLTATYNNPVYSKDEPSSPAVGDYWFDMENNTWKVYGVGAFTSASATLIGICIQDETNTVAARTFEPYRSFNSLNTVEFSNNGNALAESVNANAQLSVWGNVIRNERNIFIWDMTTDLDTGLTEASATFYYFYITEVGDTVISDQRPYDRRSDMYGWYHPYESWRCVGFAYNNGSSNLEQDVSFYKPRVSLWQPLTPTGTWSTNVTYTGFSRYWPETNEAELQFQIDLTGTPDTASLRIDVPARFRLDTSVLALPGSKTGTLFLYDSRVIMLSSSENYVGYVGYNTSDSTKLTIVHIDDVSGGVATTVTTQGVPFTFGNTHNVMGQVRFPVIRPWWY